jgi:hypothetical protein
MLSKIESFKRNLKSNNKTMASFFSIYIPPPISVLPLDSSVQDQAKSYSHRQILLSPPSTSIHPDGKAKP